MTDIDRRLEEIYKLIGIKKTKGRNAILEILINSDSPMSYDEIFLILIKKDVNINVSTVYRILETFAEKGIVNKINGGENNRNLYELSRNEHRHYFFCIKCRGFYPISNCPLSNLVEDLKKTMQVEVLEHKLEVSGVCKECKST